MAIGLTIVALIAALIVVPPFARAAGLFEKHVGYATAAVAFLIVIVAVRCIKSQNQKAADSTGTPSRKR
jgi:hypothetical protein